jgi:adenylate cyclase
LPRAPKGWGGPVHTTETHGSHPWRPAGRVPWSRWVALAVLPVLVLIVLRTRTALDVLWENHPAHFWLVLSASAVAVALGSAVSVVARVRRDARLLLVALAFIVSAGFLGLHALATPGVLLGPNPGFELATPVGLLLGGALVAASSLELAPATSMRLIRRWPWLMSSVVIVLAAWAAASLARIAPLNDPIEQEELDGWQVAFGVLGLALYGGAAFGYFLLYRRRKAQFVFSMTFAFALLAESMVVIAFAENWRISWWEWHTLMLGAFTVIALSARGEWHEERFSAIYLDETLAGAKDASILFADLQGYTSFSEVSEPGEVAKMLNAYFGRLIPLMEDHGGEVHQIIGDALMVVFNKAGDQPDHPVLAARAGLLLQREAEVVARNRPDWPRFRVGVNSGEVLAGVVGGARGHRKHGLVGDTVNLAARLETQAPVGEVVVGRVTYERLPDGSVVESLPRLRVKGKAEPVDAYVLKRLPE